jgi:hypothetical protein
MAAALRGIFHFVFLPRLSQYSAKLVPMQIEWNKKMCHP